MAACLIRFVRRPLGRQAADFVVGHQQFVDAHPPAIARPAALPAADRPVDRPTVRLPAIRSREIVGHVLRARDVRFAAFAAQRAHQPLGHDAFHRAADQERLDAHVDQPHERAGRVVGVQRAEHQVARSATPGPRSRPSPSRGFRRPAPRRDRAAECSAGWPQTSARLSVCTWIWLIPSS